MENLIISRAAMVLHTDLLSRKPPSLLPTLSASEQLWKWKAKRQKNPVTDYAYLHSENSIASFSIVQMQGSDTTIKYLVLQHRCSGAPFAFD